MIVTDSVNQEKELLVIGDLIIDETIYCASTRLSPEAPVPTAEILDPKSKIAPGGAGFTAAFLNANNNKTTLCTAITDSNKHILESSYNTKVIKIGHVERNVTKTRIIDKESGYHLLRLDNDRTVKKPQISPSDVIEKIAPLIKGGCLVSCLLSDYKKGFFDTSFDWHQLIDYLVEHDIQVLLDTRMKNIKHYMHKDKLNDKLWLKLNDKEANQVKFNLYGENGEWDTKQIPRLLNTQGSNGLTMIYEKGCVIIPVPGDFNKGGTPDTTGCGDIFDASFVEGIGIYKDFLKAAEYAVYTASKYAWIPFERKLC